MKEYARMSQQYKLTCCNRVISENSVKFCVYCGVSKPMIEEVDKEDYVITGGGFSGDKLFEERPWGNFSVILDEENVKIKRIVVKPKQSLSLQLHKHREEFWVVMSGRGMLTLGLDHIPVEEGQPIHIRHLELHSINNYADEDLVIIEIQKGICKEDDIIRLEDSYGRVDNEEISNFSSGSCCSSSKCKKSKETTT